MSDTKPQERPQQPNTGGSSRQSPPASQGIRLPPISFISNLPQVQNQDRLSASQSPIQSILNGPASGRSPESSSPGITLLAPGVAGGVLGQQQQQQQSLPPPHQQFGTHGDKTSNDTFKSRPPLLNDLLSGSSAQAPVSPTSASQLPTVPQQTDDEIIEYYSKKYEIFDFTEEEKHDILQHERRSRLEAQKNPSYKPFLCYSIIKRLNAVPVAKKPEETVSSGTKQQDTTQAEEPPRKKFVKRDVTIDNSDVLEFVTKFPRKHLGSLLYTPTPTRSSYSQLACYGGIVQDESNEIVPLLPELREHINSIVTVRIPSFYLTEFRNNPHYQKRAIWGTDVYTDDSDVLLMLKHNGFLPVIDEDIELEKETADAKQTPGNADNKQNVTQTVKNFRQFINIIGGDVHVDLIILPRLVKYSGLYRHGINSRSWSTGHDGVSVAIHGVRYGEKNSAVESINAGEIKRRKLLDVLALSDESKYELGDDGWSLSYKAWRNAKENMAREKEEARVERTKEEEQEKEDKDKK